MSRLYIVRMGPNVTLARGTSERSAREEVADRLNVRNRPWVWRTWKVDLATKADIERYGAMVDASRGRTKAKGKRPTTVTKLKRKHPELFDGPDEAA